MDLRRAISEPCMEEVGKELIAKYKCPVDCMDFDGCTPPSLGCQEGVVRMLFLKFGADIAVRIKNLDTALSLAALNLHAKVVNVLI